MSPTSTPPAVPRLTRVCIENFRSIARADVELGRLTVIIGANGSGKTNLLEAIAIAGAAAADKLDHEFLAARGIRPITPELALSRFEGAAPETGTVTVEGALAEHGLRVTLLNNGDFGAVEGMIREYQRLRPSAAAGSDAHTGLTNPLQRPDPPGLSTFLLYSPEYTALRTFADEGQILPLGVRGEGLFRHLVWLSRAAPEVFAAIGERLRVLDWFDGFALPSDLGPGEKRLAIRDRYLARDVLLDQRSANEGFLFLLFAYTLMLSPKTPRVFALDNADTSLNPRLCARLVADLAALAQSQDRQVILTTHNPALLDGLHLQDPEQRLLICERDLDGHTRFRRVEAPSAATVNLSEAFLRGYLGGLPESF